MKIWFVYILRCKDNSLYTGITNNIEKRMLAHNNGKGSKYVYARLPFKRIYTTEVENKSQALKMEYRIKKMSKKEKENLVSSYKVSI